MTTPVNKLAKMMAMIDCLSRVMSWIVKVKALKGHFCTFDQCRFGLLSPAGQPVRKRTILYTNCRAIIDKFDGVYCTQDHTHDTIQGSQNGKKVSAHCAIYPPALCKALAEAVMEACGN